MRPLALALYLLPMLASAQTGPEASAETTMYRAFVCSLYAGMIEDDAERERLFSLGYEAARQFLTPTEAERQGPDSLVALTLRASPSQDFAIGQVYGQLSSRVMDRVHTDRSLDFSQAIERARAAYRDEGCAEVR